MMCHQFTNQCIGDTSQCLGNMPHRVSTPKLFLFILKKSYHMPDYERKPNVLRGARHQEGDGLGTMRSIFHLFIFKDNTTKSQTSSKDRRVFPTKHSPLFKHQQKYFSESKWFDKICPKLTITYLRSCTEIGTFLNQTIQLFPSCKNTINSLVLY